MTWPDFSEIIWRLSKMEIDYNWELVLEMNKFQELIWLRLKTETWARKQAG